MGQREEPAPEQAHPGLTLEDIRRRLREHALWKVTMAERAAVLLIDGHSHTAIRARLDLTPEQYRRVRRWLREAMLADPGYERIERETPPTPARPTS